MIKIAYDLNPDMTFVRAEGHADYAEKGKDIVCAMVSVLMQTLGATMHKRDPEGTDVYIDEAHGIMQVTRTGLPDRECAAMFEMAADGLWMVAVEYPENVQVYDFTCKQTRTGVD